MDSNLEIRILLPQDQDAVAKFARSRVDVVTPDKMDAEMQSWVARWRPESLAYYLPQGWSFGAFQQQKMVGFLLGQPLIFFRGLTQTLWVEDLIFTKPEVGAQLLDVAYRWSKDKHLQCVLVESSPIRAQLVDGWKHAYQHEASLIELRSSRF